MTRTENGQLAALWLETDTMFRRYAVDERDLRSAIEMLAGSVLPLARQKVGGVKPS
jgi:hypothetical protein